MKSCVIIVFCLLAVGLLAISGCGSSQSELSTSVGTLVVGKTEIVEELMGHQFAAPGHQILLVWFEKADNSIIDTGGFMGKSEGVYVTGDDGSQTEREGYYVSGDPELAKEVALVFTPPITAKTFTLYWLDNPPIELPLPK